MRSQQIECPIMMFRFCLQMQEVLFPQRLIVAVGDQCPFVKRAQEVWIARLAYEREIVPPCLYAAAKGTVLIQLRQFAFELVALLDMAFGWLVKLSQMNSQQVTDFEHVPLGIAGCRVQGLLLSQLPEDFEGKLLAGLDVCLSQIVYAVNVLKRADKCFLKCLYLANGIRLQLEKSLKDKSSLVVITYDLGGSIELLAQVSWIRLADLLAQPLQVAAPKGD